MTLLTKQIQGVFAGKADATTTPEGDPVDTTKTQEEPATTETSNESNTGDLSPKNAEASSTPEIASVPETKSEGTPAETVVDAPTDDTAKTLAAILSTLSELTTKVAALEAEKSLPVTETPEATIPTEPSAIDAKKAELDKVTADLIVKQGEVAALVAERDALVKAATDAQAEYDALMDRVQPDPRKTGVKVSGDFLKSLGIDIHGKELPSEVKTSGFAAMSSEDLLNS
jgi:hypothetical protein